MYVFCNSTYYRLVVLIRGAGVRNTSIRKFQQPRGSSFFCQELVASALLEPCPMDVAFDDA